MTGLKHNLPQEVIRLGLSCNEKCVFCNVTPDSREPAGFGTALRAVCRNAAKGKPVRVSISGGEPTLYPELIELITFAGRKGVETELQTNGLILADPRAARALARAGLTHAFVSLHSHIAVLHDYLTKVRGSHDACVKAIANLVSCGIHVSLNPVLTAVNYAGIADYVRFAGRELKVRDISLSVVQPRGRVLQHRELVPDYRDLDLPVAAALKAARRMKIAVRNPVCGLPLCIGGWHKYPKDNVEYSAGKLGLPFPAAKEKTAACAKCAAGAYCAGVWREYLAIRGQAALRPLTKKEFRG